ncbi:hypothetical protein OJ996_25100 [Luteolibacter sp. GHJ8]|uniref:Suppressor of fused protein SUFU n=1 Tax=Luteolibacter rhizosphaerae TaxID=2989719 RepID=A0ABT3GBL8_9BACT|nr:hypothetical protein [Luteolibacter rhizosphaerae]MCW1916891.1 hypothetical protein [Luteolibacter rhizosphaerae]
MSDTAIQSYRKAMLAFWAEAERQGLAPFPFPGFGNASSAGSLKNRHLFSQQSLLELALDCTLAGPSALIEREDGSYFLILGTEALEKWTGEDPFIRWPFIPLASDTENFTVGLTMGAGGEPVLAAVAKEVLYDEALPQDPDSFMAVEGGVDLLPRAMSRITAEGGEMVLIDQL